MTQPGNAASIEPMTGLVDVPAQRSERVDAATVAAESAARSAAVTIRVLTTLSELDSVHALFDEIWRPDPTNPPLTKELLRALSKAGNYIAGAFRDGRLVGACVGFFGAPADEILHSHIAGVSSEVQGRSVGFALKVHQRAWALARGVSSISWTFDPLVSRNAHFNVMKLAARPIEYLPNFYGGMRDGINGDDETDRLLVTWQLNADDVARACLGRRWTAEANVSGAAVALAASELGLPARYPVSHPLMLVAVPRDVEALRRADPAQARQWRLAVRDVLGALMADGGRIVSFDPCRGYVVASAGVPVGREGAL
ncbi:MAG: hypothetical protein JWM76_4624 [Pseudonocardiales bacterium]|nr:hypothetical protein [Pseudonocardiales bacterium]